MTRQFSTVGDDCHRDLVLRPRAVKPWTFAQVTASDDKAGGSA